MKILYIHQYFSTPAGSGGTRSYTFATEMVRHGHSVTMMCGSSSFSDSGLEAPLLLGRRTGLVEGIHIVQFSGKYSNKLGVFSRVIEFLRFALLSTVEVLFGPRYDLIYASSTPLSVAIPALVGLKTRGTPFVFEVRDSWPGILIEMGVLRNRLLISLAKRLENLAYTKASALVALAPSVQRELEIARGGAENVYLIPNGSDISLFTPPRPSQRKIASKRVQELRLVYSGTHGRANGLHFLVDVAQKLEAKGISNIRFVLVGEGSEKHALETRVADLGLSSIVFLPPMPKTELAKLLPTMDLGLQVLERVHGFRDGSSPNKFFDYLASGLPVITNYPGWVSEILHTNQCGWTVGSADELAQLLPDLVRNRPLFLEFGGRARQTAVELFDRKHQAGQVVRILARIVESGSPTEK
jgi:glycosyltransferase involved in cell wall biosynthesis